MRDVFLSICLLSVFLGSPLWSQQGGASEKVLTSLGVKLGGASSAEELDAVARSAAGERRLFIGQLADILRTSASNDIKVRACYILGEFRAVEVVDYIAKFVDLEAPSKGDFGKIPLWSRYPCLDALAVIGKPAEKSLISAISRGQTAGTRDFAFSALVNLEGQRGARLQLEEALESATGEEGKRIKALLDLLKADEGRQDESSYPVRELQEAKSVVEMDKVIAGFTKYRVELVQGLVDLLKSFKDPEPKARICYLLGEVGDPRATSVLIENILVKAEVLPAFTRTLPWGQFPCQEALANIGKRAEHGIIDVLSKPASDETEVAALHVLQSLEGWRGAVFVLGEARERAGPEERKSLDSALEEARKFIR